ncbi:hypothetical protein HMPREF1609_05125 [Escherichia coli 908541]|nr:hypothetical protein ECBCE034MS14_2501 [Escherichia coli BCE034_MS-14]ESD65683.1 hypothetical protein HMPREF1609_05125 [Escherichia coli 908541]
MQPETTTYYMLCCSGSLFGDMPDHFAFKQSIISGQDFAK